MSDVRALTESINSEATQLATLLRLFNISVVAENLYNPFQIKHSDLKLDGAPSNELLINQVKDLSTTILLDSFKVVLNKLAYDYVDCEVSVMNNYLVTKVTRCFQEIEEKEKSYTLKLDNEKLKNQIRETGLVEVSFSFQGGHDDGEFYDFDYTFSELTIELSRRNELNKLLGEYIYSKCDFGFKGDFFISGSGTLKYDTSCEQIQITIQYQTEVDINDELTHQYLLINS